MFLEDLARNYIYRQVVGIPMGTNCAPLVAYLLLFCVTLCPFWFCNHLDREERAGCFA